MKRNKNIEHKGEKRGDSKINLIITIAVQLPEICNNSKTYFVLICLQDLAQYVNEVKRDNETLREIDQYQKSIENLVSYLILPNNERLFSVTQCSRILSDHTPSLSSSSSSSLESVSE